MHHKLIVIDERVVVAGSSNSRLASLLPGCVSRSVVDHCPVPVVVV